MSSFSQYLFQRHFGNSGFLTKTQTNNFGVSGTDIKKADKNEDNKISIDEILKNDAICDELMTQINNVNNVINTVVNEIASLHKKSEAMEKAEQGEENGPQKTNERRPFRGRFFAQSRDIQSIFDNMSESPFVKSFAKNIGQFVSFRA